MSSVISLLLAALLAVQNVSTQSLPAQDHASLGISLAREGKLPEAEHELREAVRVASGVASYRAQLGSILGLQGKWTQALASFQKAIDLAPENLDFRRETAAVQWQLGLMSSAEKNLQYVLERQPDDSGAILLLGLVKERNGDYKAAAELLDSQFELVISQPDRTVALFNSVVRTGQRDKIPKIIDALKLRANDKLWASAIVRCTQIAVMSGDPHTSRTLFASIPNDDPGRPAAGIQLAKLLYSRGEVSQARDLLLQLAAHGVMSADLQALLGNCFESEHQPDLAMQAYQRAIELEPSRIDYYQDPISLLLDLGKTNEALALITRALAIAPSDARPWLWKGKVGLRMNAYKDAMESYRHASSLDSSSADAILGIAAVYFVSGQSEGAIAEYKAGITRFPNDARLYVGCASMLLASPDSPKLQAEAENLLQEAMKLAPQSAEAHYQLGQLALQQSRLKDAETEFSRSLQSDPDRSKAHFALSLVYRRMGRTVDATRQFAIYQDLKRAEESGTTAAMTAAQKP
jgi:tetratricopeptide (TPR) repeat protein